MTCAEQYFENLLFNGEDNNNKKKLTPEVQETIEMCADYIINTLFNNRDNFITQIQAIQMCNFMCPPIEEDENEI